jgi:hypothetical protein
VFLEQSITLEKTGIGRSPFPLTRNFEIFRETLLKTLVYIFYEVFHMGFEFFHMGFEIFLMGFELFQIFYVTSSNNIKRNITGFYFFTSCAFLMFFSEETTISQLKK